MFTGLDMAVTELTLVVFTTLAPAAAFGLVLCMAYLFFFAKNASEAFVKTFNTCLAFPLAIAMIGLIASATHLGNPENILYVFSGVFRSPLSNEVMCAVIFLACVGVYWLLSFSRQAHVLLNQVLRMCSIISGCIFIVAVAFAYSAPTIITWNLAYVPIELCLNALFAGPLIFLATITIAEYISKTDALEAKTKCLLLLFSCVVCALNVFVFVLHGFALYEQETALALAFNLVPHYWFMLACFVVCEVLAYAACVKALARPASLVFSILFLLFMFAGIFVMRFSFYMSYLSVGV